ncbi:MAG: transcription antitermination factor NusB [Lachnospiraceae bacterium]|nr:transcription antitermination factor NusB [Dorea sp.]MCI9176954.1 transcription antitermination factor NusB [Lachnospiraceae bacterium]
MKRTELRDHIFKLVFGMEFNAADDRKAQMELYLNELTGAGEKDLEYIRAKTEQIGGKLAEIDKLINETAKGWKTSRMNKADLSILRLAVYEMRWDDDVPVGVAIDEAVELAKKYSSDDGPSFINGVLAKLAAS